MTFTRRRVSPKVRSNQVCVPNGVPMLLGEPRYGGVSSHEILPVDGHERPR